MKIQNLQIGTRILDPVSHIVWLIASRNHSDYPGIILISDESVGSICYDSVEPDNMLDDRKENGSNDFSLSNVLQWLNAEGTDWFHPLSPSDRAPENRVDPMMPPEFAAHMPKCITQEDPGFLTSMAPALKSALLQVDVPYIKMEQEGTGIFAVLQTKVFIPTQTELGLFVDIEYPDGTCLKLMEDSRMKLCHQGYWTRTPGFHDAEDIVLPYHMRVDKTTGIVRVMEGMLYKFYGNKACASINGVRPVVAVDGTLDVAEAAERNTFTIL